jgi:Asp-tRNA(Asn)/Glu-tRNA(Gln) amidotransferase A subunit family amidase
LTSYDLQTPALPRVAGHAARALATMLERRGIGRLILAKLMRDAGIDAFRAREIGGPPTLAPLWTAAERATPQTPARGVEELADLRPLGEIPYTTVRQYAESYRTGAVSPVSVAEAVLDAIAASDAATPPLRGFIAANRADVLGQAREAARRFERGAALSPLDGVPVAVKDEIDQRPYGTTLGTSFLGRAGGAADAAVVARLRASGALLVGKTNMHEIGLGVTGLNAHHGTPRNPFDPARHTGGSSSGSAAVVAAGICPVAIGADGGGSIRIPSALCGVVGLKPTFGRVSEHGAVPLCWSLAHLGPIAASAADAALLYAAIAGPDARDPHSLAQPPVRVDGIGGGDIAGLVLGVFRPWFEDADPEIVGACDRTIAALIDAGARVREIVIPELEDARVAHAVTISAEMLEAMAANAGHRTEHGTDVRINLAIARAFTARDYVHAQRVRTRAMQHLSRALELADVIVTPATGALAPEVRADALRGGESDVALLSALMRFASIANLTGHPAIAFPAGASRQGLPIGMQAIGRPWEEHVLLRLARAAERVVERPAPRISFRPLVEASGRAVSAQEILSASAEHRTETDSGEWYDRRKDGLG